MDARDKGDVHFVATLDFTLSNEAAFLKKTSVKGITPTPTVKIPPLLQVTTRNRPIVVGTGPAGLFAGYLLAKAGTRPILLERGKKVEERIQDVALMKSSGLLDPESNIQFGEGGAGTFSDGKLTTGIKSPWQRFVLDTFVAHGAPEDILWDQMPHIGTDKLRLVVAALRKTIESLGGEFRFSTCMEELLIKGSHVEGVKVRHAGTEELLFSDTVLLAIGHSARDTVASLFAQGVHMEQKPFAMGVRIEHPQAVINKAQYGKFATNPALKAAPYKLAVRTPDERGVYTFCMCPGGEVVPAASELGRLCVNGMSNYARDGINANSALLVGIRPEDFGDDHPLAGIALQRQIEEKAFHAGGGGYRAPVQRVEDLLAQRATKALGDVQPSY